MLLLVKVPAARTTVWVSAEVVVVGREVGEGMGRGVEADVVDGRVERWSVKRWTSGSSIAARRSRMRSCRIW